MAMKCGLGQTKCDDPVQTPGFGASMLGWDFQVVGPLGRVYLAAKDAKQKMKKFGREDITAEMLSPTVSARARWVDKDMRHNVAVEHIVIIPKGKKDQAVQPLKIENWNYDAKNLVGGSITRIGKEASFDIVALPAGDLEVVIIAGGSAPNYEIGVSLKDRKRLGF